MTKEERESIIDEAVERVLLLLPAAMGNLIMNHVTMSKLNKKFYDEHPEFVKHKDVVAAVVEKVEGVRTFSKYEEVLKDSVSEIKKMIKMKGKLDTTTVTRPNRKLSDVDLGEL